MATKKNSFKSTATGNSRMNFRPSSDGNRSEVKGNKPLPEPSSVIKILVMMIVHFCRKALFIDTKIKVAIYGGCLFIISLIADFLPIPKTYLSRTDNILNVYFVKIGWGWTLLFVLPFIVLTSYTYCCGDKKRIIKHLLRLAVATMIWYISTSIFSYIEYNYGKCYGTGKSFNKRSCINAGFIWRSLDISGHSFLLIYSSLFIIEEAKAINGWEGINDLIRNEDYLRTTSNDQVEISSSPLRLLNTQEFYILKDSYEKYTPFVRGLFIAMTLLSFLWDFMLLGTILYHHIMIEKFIGGATAIVMWFFTYYIWFSVPNSVPCLPGDGGIFRYQASSNNTTTPLAKRNISTNSTCSNNAHKTFMGMPIYSGKSEETIQSDSQEQSPSVTAATKYQRKRKEFFDS